MTGLDEIRKLYVNKNDANMTIAFYYYNGSDIVVKEFLSDKSELRSDFFQHFLNKNVENIYISAPIVYNSTDIMEKYTKCGMCFPLNDRLSDFLKKHTDLYAGMYLDWEVIMIYVFLAKGFEEIEALTVVDYLRRAEMEVYTVDADRLGERFKLFC